MASGIAQFAAMAASLVFMPLLVRHFGLQAFGLYMLATTISGYTWVLDFGVGATIQKRVAELEAKGDRRAIGELVSSAFFVYVLVGLLSAATLLVIALLSGTIFKLTPQGALLFRNLLLIASAQSLLAWPLSIGQHVLAGLQRQTLVARTSLLVTLATIAAIAITLIAGQGPLVMYVATTLAILSGAVFNTAVSRRLLKGVPTGAKLITPTILRSIVAFSWPVFVSQLVGMIVYQQTDRLVLMVFVGAAAVGLYEAVGKFQGLVIQLASMTSSAVMPMASSLDAKQHDVGIRTLFLRGSKLSLILIAPAVLALIIFARPLLLRWLGPTYLTVALAAQVMVSHQLLTAGTGVGDSIVVGRGLLKKRLPYLIGIAIGNLALSVALVRPLGILGVVLGTTIPYYIEYPLHVRFLLKELDVPLGRWLREVVLPVYPLLIVPTVVGIGLAQTRFMGNLIGVAVCMVVTVVVYWLAVFAFSLSGIEREEVRALMRKAKAAVTRASTAN